MTTEVNKNVTRDRKFLDFWWQTAPTLYHTVWSKSGSGGIDPESMIETLKVNYPASYQTLLKMFKDQKGAPK